MLIQSDYLSPLGRITMVANKESIKGIWFEHQKYYGLPYDLKLISNEENLVTDKIKQWLDTYFLGKNPTIDSTILAPEVTPFRKKVLDVLLEIPYGKTITYKEIATILEEKQNGKKSSARAVGGAVGHNPISLLIPCHRVIGSDGSLTGYAGGIERKIELLTLEGVIKKGRGLI